MQSKNSGKVRNLARDHPTVWHAIEKSATNRHPSPVPFKQMDRFIPNRSSSNLNVASYNIAMEMKDSENLQDAAGSPSKVRPSAEHSKHAI
jgi:hypothetical protein